jgi:hypothetical protein
MDCSSNQQRAWGQEQVYIISISVERAVEAEPKTLLCH